MERGKQDKERVKMVGPTQGGKEWFLYTANIKFRSEDRNRLP